MEQEEVGRRQHQEPVRDDAAVQVHQGQHQEQEAENAVFQGLQGQAEAEDQGEEQQGAQGLDGGVPGGYPLAAVAAFSPEEQVAQQGHQIQGGQGVAAPGAVRAPPGDSLMVDQPPRPGVAEGAEHKAQQHGEEEEVGGGVGGQGENIQSPTSHRQSNLLTRSVGSIPVLPL